MAKRDAFGVKVQPEVRTEMPRWSVVLWSFSGGQRLNSLVMVTGVVLAVLTGSMAVTVFGGIAMAIVAIAGFRAVVRRVAARGGRLF